MDTTLSFPMLRALESGKLDFQASGPFFKCYRFDARLSIHSKNTTHFVRQGSTMRPENGRNVELFGAGHRDPSLTRFSYVKTFNRLFQYKAGT